MKRLFYVLFCLGLILAGSSCKDIVAEDITNRTPQLIIPTLNDTVMQNPVQFKWEEMEGATKYRLQVVSPSFSTISDYILDTIVYGTTFNFPLDSAEFELKLTAMNGGYSSQTLGPIKFWVGLSPTINTSTVVLDSPLNNMDTNETFDGYFDWQLLTGASTYEFSLRKGSSFETGTIIHPQNNIEGTSLTLPATVTLTEGTYYWGVKAYTSTAESPFSIRSFKIDHTDPGTPSLISPASMSLMNVGPIDFTWSTGTDPGTTHSTVHSYIEVSTDAGFTTIYSSDDVVGNTATLDIADAGNYYWRVYNYDEAGNVSSYSSVFQFNAN